MDVGNLSSGSSAFSKSKLNIWKFLVHVLLKPRFENFEHYFASMRDECKCVEVYSLALPCSSPVATAEFSKFAHLYGPVISFVTNR